MKIGIWGSENLDLYKDIISLNDIKQVCIVVENAFEKRKLMFSDTNLNVLLLEELIYQIKENNIYKFIVLDESYGFLYNLQRLLYRKNITNFKDLLYYASKQYFIELLALFNSFNDILIEEKNILPMIASLDFMLTESCNMKCKRCIYFSNLVKGSVIHDTEEVKHSLSILKNHVHDIYEVSLLGGEPLLNPKWEEFISVVHDIYPNCHIHLITNGLLLDKISEDRINILKKHKVIVDVSVYPMDVKRVRNNIKNIENKGVDVNKKSYKSVRRIFWSTLSEQEHQFPESAMCSCLDSFCHSMRGDILYHCAKMVNVNLFNTEFKKNLPINGFNVLNSNAEMMKEYLLEPVELCKYCNEPERYKWERDTGEHDVTEWYTRRKQKDIREKNIVLFCVICGNISLDVAEMNVSRILKAGNEMTVDHVILIPTTDEGIKIAKLLQIRFTEGLVTACDNVVAGARSVCRLLDKHKGNIRILTDIYNLDWFDLYDTYSAYPNIDVIYKGEWRSTLDKTGKIKINKVDQRNSNMNIISVHNGLILSPDFYVEQIPSWVDVMNIDIGITYLINLNKCSTLMSYSVSEYDKSLSEIYTNDVNNILQYDKTWLKETYSDFDDFYEDTYIWGSGDNGRKTFESMSLDLKNRTKAFIDMDENQVGKKIYGLPIISPELFKDLKNDDIRIIVAVYDNIACREVLDICSQMNIKYIETSIFCPLRR